MNTFLDPKEITWSKTKYGNKKALVGGYSYYKDKNGEGSKEYWKCSESYCKGRMCSRENTLIEITIKHCHPPECQDNLVAATKVGKVSTF